MIEKINAISETRRRALLGLAVLGLSHITTRTWALELDATSHAQPSAALTDAQAQEQLWDVIVVGSGLAGSASALAALEAGATRVLLLEKGPIMGGHSAYSTGSLTACDIAQTKKATREPARLTMRRGPPPIRTGRRKWSRSGPNRVKWVARVRMKR